MFMPVAAYEPFLLREADLYIVEMLYAAWMRLRNVFASEIRTWVELT